MIPEGSEAKAYLSQVRLYDSIIEEKRNEILHMQEIREFITPAYSGMTGGAGATDKIGDTSAIILDLQDELNRIVEDYTALRKKALEAVDMIRNPNYHATLYKRFFEFKKFEVIASEMGYSVRAVKGFNQRALETLGKIMKGDTNNG